MNILDVGCGDAKVPGAIGIDKADLTGVDVVHDLNQFPWPLDDETFDEIYMNDIIEHLDDSIKVMEQVYRLLKPGGKVYIRVVYWNHRYSYGDPTHVKVFNEITFEQLSGKWRDWYTKARFDIKDIEYIWDGRAKRIFRFKKLLSFLSYFLCNVKQGLKVTMIKIKT